MNTRLAAAVLSSLILHGAGLAAGFLFLPDEAGSSDRPGYTSLSVVVVSRSEADGRADAVARADRPLSSDSVPSDETSLPDVPSAENPGAGTEAVSATDASGFSDELPVAPAGSSVADSGAVRLNDTVADPALGTTSRSATGKSGPDVGVLDNSDSGTVGQEDDELSTGPVSMPPGLLDSLEPDYPFQARRLGIEGDVFLEILVDATGHVEDCRFLEPRGHRLLERAAADAVLNSRFQPGTVGGRPSAGVLRLRVRFELEAPN